MVKSAETVRSNTALQQTFTRKETTPWVVFNNAELREGVYDLNFADAKSKVSPRAAAC